jgi:hypothetical protein
MGEDGPFVTQERKLKPIPEGISKSPSREKAQMGWKARHRALTRVMKCGGDGLALSNIAAEVMELMTESASAAAGVTPPMYLWPAAAPATIPVELNMDRKTVHKRELLVRHIELGVEDMAKTHVPLSVLVPDVASCEGRTSAATAEPYEQLHAAATEGAATPAAAGEAGGPAAAAAVVAAGAAATPTVAGAAGTPAAAVVAAGAATAGMVAHTRTSTAAGPPVAEHQLSAAVSSLGSQQRQSHLNQHHYHHQQQQHPQVYRLEDLQQHAQAVASGLAAGQQLNSQEIQAVVPDSTRPFTITMRNGKDGEEYVVAHYEPDALKYGAREKAAMLCQIYQGRHRGHRMSRISAPDNEKMVMAGMRINRLGLFSRYTGDEGEIFG